MKKLTLILSLIFTVTLSSPSYAEWTRVGESVDGTIFYVDFERIRKHGEYVYYWVATDYLKPTEYGDLSSKEYIQGDCKLFKVMRLSISFHTQPMGKGTPSTTITHNLKKEWIYPSPNSSTEHILKSVCSR
jgi:hypothetical protein